MLTDEMVCVHNLQRFCLHDGPGVRTVLFLQGCPLQCRWCHNPLARPVRRLPNRSDQAGDVVHWQDEFGQGEAGQWRSVTEVLQELQRDRTFWQASGGGVTLSGGEPLLQIAAVQAILTALHANGVSVAIETSGHVPGPHIDAVLPLVDHWLFDVKTVNPITFQQQVGGDAMRALGNLHRVCLGAPGPTTVTVRVPLIANFNDNEADLAAIGEAVSRLPRSVAIQVLPGHDIGRGATGDSGTGQAQGSFQVSAASINMAVDILRQHNESVMVVT